MFCLLSYQILQADGDPLDACSLASFVALQSCKVPRVELFTGETGQLDDFDIFADLADSLLLDVTGVPIIVTAYQV